MQQIPSEWQDLGATQRDVLVVLSQHAPATGQELADELTRDSSTVHRTLVGLRKRGLVHSETDTDARGAPTTNELTDSGRDLLREVGAVWHEVSVAVAL